MALPLKHARTFEGSDIYVKIPPTTIPDEPITPTPTDGMRKRMQTIDKYGAKGRVLVVGCDGTWVNADDDPCIPTNVTRICRSLRSSPRPTPIATPKDTMPAARREQVIYYHRGIGTNGDLDSKWIGGGTGDELGEHARECYGFLCDNWREGDDIALFGFSRGAYTARVVSALIADVGLLTTLGMEWFFEVYEDWMNQNIASKEKLGPVKDGVFEGLAQRPKMPSNEYREELKKRGFTTLDVPVSIVGVWDTVGSLGIPPILGLNFNGLGLLQASFTNTKVSQCVVHAFQALGLDEHRAAFSPAVWEVPDVPNNLKTLKQTWFPGVHCNTGGGGGYEDQGLANISLAWMVSQIQAVTNNDGTKGVLDFDEEYLKWSFNQNIEHVQKVRPKEGFRGWALGKIENTLILPYSVVGKHKPWAESKSVKDWILPGDLPRCPGKYEAMHADGGKGVKSGRLLKNTCERIHPCTRFRTMGGGKGISTANFEPASYTAKALEGWECIGEGDKKNPIKGGFEWISPDGKTTLQEDVMGRMEKELFGMSQQAFMLAA